MSLRTGAALLACSFALALALFAFSTSEADSNGTAWTQLGTTTLSERQHAAVAFNAATSQLVLFGGDNSVGVVNDTWVFDGTRWNRLQPPQSPRARTSASMVYFPVTRSVILFGGDTHTLPNGLLNSTWSFDGTNWTLLQPAHQPPPRYDASMAYDPVNHEIVLFGGFVDQVGFVNDTWTFDGNDWTQQSGDNAPPVRYGAGMAADSNTNSVILFGGLGFTPAGTTAYLADTWSWKDHQWTQLNPTTSPPGRWEPAMTENVNGGVTLFGGYSDAGVANTGGKFSDTWIWNGTTWTQSNASGPAARYGAAMTQDSASNADVMVAGCCNGVGGFFTDTWSFDGNAWTRHERTDAPSVRFGAAIATDADHNQIALFGGFGGDGFLGDTWIEKNGSWTQLQTSTTPPGRFAGNLTYDLQNHEAVLFGGQAGPNAVCSLYPDPLNQNHFCDDTWTFDGQTWTRRAITAASPPYRSLAAMAYDGDHQQTVLFGGHSGQDVISDTWTWDGLTWTQQSPSHTPPGEQGASPGLESAAMAWDPVHHQLILFGGLGNDSNGPKLFNETWTWTGSDWQQLNPPTSPPPVKAATMNFDPALGGLVLTTGQSSGPGFAGTTSDAWLWDGTTWTQLPAANPPPPRYFASGAFDPTLGSTVMFGGGGDDGIMDDTWNLSLAEAATPTPTVSPTPTPSATASPSPTASPSATASPGATTSPTPTVTPTITPSPSPSPSATPTPAQFLNISTRADVRTGDEAMIAGFIITGDHPKNVLVRGLGPSLNVNGTPVAGRLDDPTLELRDQNGALILFNDNWKDSQQAQIEATHIPPSDDREAAIVQQLNPGRYTAVLRGRNATTGIGIVEVYDLDGTTNPQLANISTRGFVETGDDVMIGGFIAGPNDRGGLGIVARALGPSLAASKVPQTLDDPTLELRDANGALIAANDDWASDGEAAKVVAAGLAPTDPRESAFYRDLPPAAFTAIVRGKGGTTGNALVEIYNLQ